jgi:hypothetical protein
VQAGEVRSIDERFLINAAAHRPAGSSTLKVFAVSTAVYTTNYLHVSIPLDYGRSDWTT